VDQVSQTDPVPADVRAARNEALLPVLNMFPCGGGIVDYVYEPPEVVTAGYFRDVTWVVGTFENYRVISADSSNEALIRMHLLLRRDLLWIPMIFAEAFVRWTAWSMALTSPLIGMVLLQVTRTYWGFTTLLPGFEWVPRGM
jgi:hypothetical protein